MLIGTQGVHRRENRQNLLEMKRPSTRINAEGSYQERFVSRRDTSTSLFDEAEVSMGVWSFSDGSLEGIFLYDDSQHRLPPFGKAAAPVLLMVDFSPSNRNKNN